MTDDRPLRIPVLLGTTRKGRRSAAAARYVVQRLAERPGVATKLIDLAEMKFPIDDAGESIKDPVFSKEMDEMDGLVIVSPEYNHSFPGLLKHALDTNLEEYIHKAVGVAGVSAGPFGGTRVIESFLPVLRELGFMMIFTDLNFGSISKVFSEEGELLEPAFERRTDKFLDELIWMSKVLRHGRETLSG